MNANEHAQGHAHNTFLIFPVKNNSVYCPNCLIDWGHNFDVENGNELFDRSKVNAKNAQVHFGEFIQKYEKHISDREAISDSEAQWQGYQQQPNNHRGKLIMQALALYGICHICYCMMNDPVRGYLALAGVLFICCALKVLKQQRGARIF